MLHDLRAVAVRSIGAGARLVRNPAGGVKAQRLSRRDRNSGDLHWRLCGSHGAAAGRDAVRLTGKPRSGRFGNDQGNAAGLRHSGRGRKNQGCRDLERWNELRCQRTIVRCVAARWGMGFPRRVGYSEPMSRMLEEIREQPAALERSLAGGVRSAARLARAIRERRPRLILLVARGTSDNAAQFGRYLLELTTGIPVSLAAPSIYTLYKARVDLREALVIGVS